MELTPDTVDRFADDYERRQPLAAVEAEHLELLPSTLENGAYGWRDVEWIPQWFYRRFLGTYPDDERRAAESAFGENDFEDLEAAIAGAVDADSTAAKLDSLTTLAGVDVPVATAFLQFLEPERYLVMSEREWETLRERGELERPYPDDPTVEAYDRYLETCRDVARRCDCTLWTLYRALWVVGEAAHE